MHGDEIQESLDQLRAEIKKLGKDDKAIRKRMKQLVADLEGKLESSEELGHEPQLIEGIRRNVERFEVEHPRLTGVLNQMMVELSNMGI